VEAASSNVRDGKGMNKRCQRSNNHLGWSKKDLCIEIELISNCTSRGSSICGLYV